MRSHSSWKVSNLLFSYYKIFYLNDCAQVVEKISLCVFKMFIIKVLSGVFSNTDKFITFAFFISFQKALKCDLKTTIRERYKKIVAPEWCLANALHPKFLGEKLSSEE